MILVRYREKMKKTVMKIHTILAAIAMTASLFCAQAQDKPSSSEFLERYNKLVSKLGAAGVGVETVIQKWEAAYPDDIDMLTAKFSYYFTKSQDRSVQVMDADKYLGEKPALSLTDSLGKKVNYFQVTNYDDDLFANATSAIDKAIGLERNRLDLRFMKTAALLAYEKDSPDMTLSDLKALVDYNGHTHPQWSYPDFIADEDFFKAAVQEYCYSFFRIGTPQSFEAFRQLSEKMLEYWPNDTLFLTNLGSYYLVCKKDNKSALKYYNKVLKLSPNDYTAAKNCVLMARAEKDVKLEKKYLPILIRATEDEAERLSAEARLKSL